MLDLRAPHETADDANHLRKWWHKYIRKSVSVVPSCTCKYKTQICHNNLLVQSMFYHLFLILKIQLDVHDIQLCFTPFNGVHLKKIISSTSVIWWSNWILFIFGIGFHQTDLFYVKEVLFWIEFWIMTASIIAFILTACRTLKKALNSN